MSDDKNIRNDDYENTRASLDEMLDELEKMKDKHENSDGKSPSDNGDEQKIWSMADIDKLLDDGTSSAEDTDFDFSKYEKYTDYVAEAAEEKFSDRKDSSGDIYFTRKTEPERINSVEDVTTEFEDVSSSSEGKEPFRLNIEYSEDEYDLPEKADEIVKPVEESSEPEEDEFDFSQTLEDENKENSVLKEEISEDEKEEDEEVFELDFGKKFDDSSIEDIVNETFIMPETDKETEDLMKALEPDEKELKRRKEEFCELDEEELEKANESSSDEELNHGDFLRIKDIFKKSKILSKRREQRAKAKTEAEESIKEKFGKDVFTPKKKTSEELENMLKEDEKTDEVPQNAEVKFDIESGEHLVVPKAEEKEQEEEKPARENKPEAQPKEERTMLFNIDENAQTEQPKKMDLSEFDGGYPVEDENPEGQMKFEGFVENENEADDVPEEEIDSNLIFSSNERKRRFKLTHIPEDYNDVDTSYYSKEKGKYDDEEFVSLNDEDETNSVSDVLKGMLRTKKEKTLDEYRSQNEIPQIFKELKDKRKSYLLSLVGLVILEIFSFIFNKFPLALQLTGSVAAASAINISVSLVILLLAFCVCSQVIQNGFRGIFKAKINRDSLVSIAMCLSVVASIASFFNLTEVNVSIPLYVPVVIFIMIISCYAHFVSYARTIGNFKSITGIGRETIHCVQTIDNKEDADVVARISSKRNARIRYSSKVDFPGRFLFNSFSNHPADKFTGRMMIISLILSLIVALVASIVSKSAIGFFVTLCGALCVCVPTAMMVATDLPLRRFNKKLNKENSCITGYNALKEIGKTNSVIVKASDLYDAEKCNFHGMHEYQTVRVDDIVLYTAAMLTKSKGPLSHAFDKVIISGQEDMLPEVEDLFYEEKLGLSGWIHGQKILVGNRNLLINHNLEAPPKSDELSVTRDDKKVLYVAVDSQVAAMLVVSYAPNENARDYLNRLNKNGVNVIVSTNDCNVDEETLSLQFNIPRESFRVVGEYEGSILDPYLKSHKKAAPAKIVHSGSSNSFLKSISDALLLSSSQTIVTLGQLISTLIGLIAVLVTSCIGGGAVLGAGILMLYHLISVIAVTAAVFIKSKI